MNFKKVETKYNEMFEFSKKEALEKIELDNVSLVLLDLTNPSWLKHLEKYLYERFHNRPIKELWDFIIPLLQESQQYYAHAKVVGKLEGLDFEIELYSTNFEITPRNGDWGSIAPTYEQFKETLEFPLSRTE